MVVGYACLGSYELVFVYCGERGRTSNSIEAFLVIWKVEMENSQTLEFASLNVWMRLS